MPEALCASDSFVSQTEILTGDAGPGGLCRVRQRAMRCDSINRNDRVYPRAVVQAAIDECLARARSGAMLSEMQHPAVARVDGQDFFVDQHDRKTARVDDIIGVDAEGWVYVDRTILDTPHGKQVAAGVRAGKPLGISTRFRMSGRRSRIDGRSVTVADAMHLHTWDDVPNPAVDGAGSARLLTDSQTYQLLTDAQGQELLANRRGDRQEDMTMNEALKRACGNYTALVTDAARKASPEQLKAARDEYHSAILDAQRAGEPVVEHLRTLAALDDMASAGNGGGLVSGRQAPTFTEAKCAATPSEPGFAPDGAQLPNPPGTDQFPKPFIPTGMTDAQVVAAMREQIAAKAAADAEAKRAADIQAAIDAQGDTLKGLSDDARQIVVTNVKRMARTAEDVPQLLTDQVADMSRIIAANRLASQGLHAGGQTVNDPAAPGAKATALKETNPVMGVVDRICAAVDDYRLTASGEAVTDSVRQRREYNRTHFIDKLIDEWTAKKAESTSFESWCNATDSTSDDAVEKAISASFDKSDLAVDSTTLSNAYNQPAIMMAVLVQSYQDMKALQFVQGIGPGTGGVNAAGWSPIPNAEQAGFGSVFRIPVEYYTEPTGYGTMAGPQFDAGLAVPEGGDIPEGVVTTYWLEFSPTWRRIGASFTKDVVKAMGHGPLNYPLVARHLWHITQHKARVMDKVIFDEFIDAADRYGSVSVSSETVNNTNNSSYYAGGSTQVNLNPTKTANASVVSSSDNYVTYGTNVIAAIRVKGRGNATSSPYCGTAYGVDPLVKPYVHRTLSANGQLSTTTDYAISISAPAAQVEGYIDATGQIQNLPGGGTATYACDHENGVIVFNSASTVTGSGSAVTTTITLSYYYVTNFDSFYWRFVDNTNASLLATGETPSMYWNRFAQILDDAGAVMGSRPRYNTPNFGIMSLAVASKLINSQIFYKLASPDGTKLYPTPDWYATRNEIDLARINSPWRCGDRRVLLGRIGATKYAVDTPFELNGPIQLLNGNTNAMISKQGYFAEEASVVCTPQVTKTDGTVLNPFYRSVKLW